MNFRDLVLGSNVFIPSRVDYRNAILRSQLAIITFVVSIGYIFIDMYHGIAGNEPYYFAVAMLAIITMVLNCTPSTRRARRAASATATAA